MKWIDIVIASLVMTVGPVYAQAPQEVKPLTFAAWRESQVLEAQNQVLRAQTRVTQLKSGKGSGRMMEPADLPSNTKLKRVGDGEGLVAAEQDLKRAQEIADNASKAQFEDYVEVYIPSLADHPEAVQKLADKLTREELVEIFKRLMRTKQPLDAKRNGSLVGALSLSPRSNP